ncbi:hypothetical protein DL96DRAFT_1627576 [Flagelloscypha sp. PMI_526]|nr:hypothetical protein DL96DRAFT_1627576 [Flagelloscypha sp. PMI_526]
MSTIGDLPDELLQNILFYSTAKDLDGHIARSVYSVSRRWNHVISPVLYRHVAWCTFTLRNSPASPSAQNTVSSSVELQPSSGPSISCQLFKNLETKIPRADIEHLIIHDNMVPSEILRKLAHYSYHSLRTLTIWPSETMNSRIRFFDDTAEIFPLLTRIVFVGNISIYQRIKSTRPSGPPRYPNLTHLHLIGSQLYPPFAHAEDAPMLSSVIYSHLSYNDARIVLGKTENGIEWLRDHSPVPGLLLPQIRQRVVYHAASHEGTLASVRTDFEETCMRVKFLMTQPWIQGMSLVVEVKNEMRPHDRTPDEDSWDAVLHRLVQVGNEW